MSPRLGLLLDGLRLIWIGHFIILTVNERLDRPSFPDGKITLGLRNKLWSIGLLLGVIGAIPWLIATLKLFARIHGTFFIRR